MKLFIFSSKKTNLGEKSCFKIDVHIGPNFCDKLKKQYNPMKCLKVLFHSFQNGNIFVCSLQEIQYNLGLYE